jgi:hypothetical protein
MDTNQRHAQAQHEVRQTSREDAPTGWSKKARLAEKWAEGESEMIPTWLVQIGSMAGLFRLAFTVFDRLLAGLGREERSRQSGWSYLGRLID